MKKTLLIFTLMVLSASAAFAHGDEMGKEGDKKMMMHGMMMMKMMERTVVATSDGGVVIVSGNKLTKYDRSLKLVKEVDLPGPMEGMKNMMGEDKHKCGCHMMKKEHHEAKTEASKPEENKTDAAADHSGHH